MPRARVTLLLAAAALLAGSLLAAPVRAGQRTLHLIYQGSVGDAPVLSAAINATLPARQASQGRYAMTADIRLVGALGEMFPFQMQAQATGAAGAMVTPMRYSSATTLFGAVSRIELDYGAGGRVAIAAEPPTAEAREAAAQGLAHDTLDPLSAVSAVIAEVARTGRCGGTVAVFDGTRRYELALSHVGDAVVTRLRRSLYEGPAIECRIVPVLQAGFRPRETASGVYPREALVWLAPVVAGGPSVPVRILARSSLGTLLVDLVDARASQ